MRPAITAGHLKNLPGQEFRFSRASTVGDRRQLVRLVLRVDFVLIDTSLSNVALSLNRPGLLLRTT